MRLTGEIDANCGMHRYPTTFPLGDDVLASVDVLVRTSWNGDGYDDDYRGCDWSGALLIYGVMIAVKESDYKKIAEDLEAHATEYFEDKWHNLMLSRL